MRIAAAISATLHVAVFLISWIGISPSSRPMISSEKVIEVEIAMEAETAKPKPRPKPAPKRAPPPPEPQIAALPEPAAVPVPKIKPPKKVAPKPKPKVEKKQKPKPKKRIAKPKPRPKAKPKPPPKHNFASVLKTVSKLKKPAPREPKKKKPAPLQQVAKLLKQKRPVIRSLQTRDGLSANELEAVKRQIEPCWNLPSGARDAEKMIVEIRATVNPDGRVRSAFIADKARARSDVFYRAMAESALRAILNHQCQPLPLPLEKYNEWRDMVIFFDPQEMF